MGLPRAGLRSRFALILVASAFTPPALSWAQPTPPPPAAAPGTTAPELDPNARVQRPAPRRDAGVFAPEPPGPCPLEGSDVQVTLNAVSFRGSTALSAEELRGAYADYLGKPQPVAIICAIRDRAARAYFEAGVLARVEIPEQRIADGALMLEVIEAHVVNVRVRGDVGPVQDAIERYAEKLRGMKPFDMAKAQRYLLLASDVPGVRVRAAVRPSTSPERGAVDIDLTVVRDNVSAFANVQNLGSRPVGRWAGLVRGEVSALTGYGEATGLTFYRTLEANEQWLVQLTESARFGSEGLVGRAAFTYGESRPGGALKALGLKSESVVGNVEAAYPLIRLRNQNLNLAGGVDFINQETTVPGAGRISQDKLRILYARADGDYRTELGEWPMLVSGAVTVRKGLSGLGASDEGSPFLTRAIGKPDAWVVKGVAGVDTVVSDRITAMMRVQAQYSGSPLLPYEQISLGSLTVGRGYNPATALGDTGVAGAFELRYGPLQLHPRVVAAPYAFFDAGYVRNNDATLSGLARDRTLKSVGAGVVFRVANRANVEVTYAHPLDSRAPGRPRAGDRVLIQLTASLM